MMDVKALVPVGMAVGICIAIAKFVPNQMVKAAALGTAGVIVAKRLPVIGAAL